MLMAALRVVIATVIVATLHNGYRTEVGAARFDTFRREKFKPLRGAKLGPLRGAKLGP